MREPEIDGIEETTPVLYVSVICDADDREGGQTFAMDYIGTTETPMDASQTDYGYTYSFDRGYI